MRPGEFDTASLTPAEPLAGYLDLFRPVFRRRDTREVARLYATGLLSALPRKNGETMEAAIPGATQENVHNFLVRSPWSAAELDRLRVLDGVERAGCGGLPVDGIIDEVSIPKKGSDSVGVARQYLGCLGKTDNGQVVVSLHLSTDDFDLPGTAELFLPEKRWGGTDEACRQRRAEAKVPADWVFRTKPELAVALLLRVRAWGLQLRRVYADAGYAGLAMILRLLELGLEFVLAIRSNDTVRLVGEPWLPAVPPHPPTGHPGRPRGGQPSRPHLHTPEELRAGLVAEDWHAVAYRQDVNGTPLVHAFAAFRAHAVSVTKLKRQDPAVEAESPELWLLLEQPCGPDPHRKDELKQYVISGSDTLTLDELADLALPFAHKSEVTKHSGRFGALRRPTQRGVGGALRGPLVRTTQSSACSPRDRLDHRLGDRNAADWERSRRRDGVGPRGSGPQRGVDARAEPVRPRGRGWHSPRTWCASRCSPAT